MPTRKFTEQDIHDIRCRHRKHIHHKGLGDLYKPTNQAAMYGVAPNTIYDIVNGVTYGYIPDKYCADQE